MQMAAVLRLNKASTHPLLEQITSPETISIWRPILASQQGLTVSYAVPLYGNGHLHNVMHIVCLSPPML